MKNAELRELIETRTGDHHRLRGFFQKRLPQVFREVSEQAKLTQQLNDMFTVAGVVAVGRAARAEWPDAFAPPKSVFICYRRTGSANHLAQRLDAKLRAAGLEVFLDVGMAPGTPWREEINRQIDTSDVFVVLVADDTGESEMVIEELGRAVSRQSSGDDPLIFPVRVESEAPLTGDLALHLGGLQYALWSSEGDDERIVGQIAGKARPPEAKTLAVSSAVSLTQWFTLGTSAAIGPHDAFFVKRLDQELRIFAESRTSLTYVVCGPRRVGKTSLAMHAMALVEPTDENPKAMAAVLVDFRVFASVVQSFQEFQFQVARIIHGALGVEMPNVSEFNETSGLGDYLRYVLRRFKKLTLVLDGVDLIADKNFSAQVFGMLRVWTERRALPNDYFSKHVRILALVAMEPQFLIESAFQSLMNVGEQFQLGPLSLGDCHELNRRCEQRLNESQTTQLHTITGGLPQLVKRGLFELSFGRKLAGAGASANDRWQALVMNASDPHGIFGDHLRATAKRLMDAQLLSQFQSLMTRRRVDDDSIHVLKCMGVVQPSKEGWQPTAEIYRDYLMRLQ